MPALAVIVLFAAAPVASAPAGPAGAVALTATAWSGPGQVAYAALRPPEAGTGHLAWRMTRDDEGQPLLEAFSFLLMETTFSLAGQLYPWPVICEQSRSWDDVRRGFQLVVGGWRGDDAPCTFQGTVYFKATLIPRSDVRPVVEVSVEGPQGSVAVPVRVLLDERRQTDWTGIPVILGQLSTTALADGFQRLRITGGWREYQVDGDPGTAEFEDGGDANVAFVVQNGPARLMRLAVFTGSATAYDGKWERVGGASDGRMALTRTGGVVAWLRGATGPQAVVVLGFSVPVGQVEVELRRTDGAAIALAPEHVDGTEAIASVWRADLDAGEISRGEWAFHVVARDEGGRELEPLTAPAVRVAELGVLRPDTGECFARGRRCRLGADEAHRISVRPGMMAHGR